MEPNADSINKFKDFTGASDEAARQSLVACDGNLEQAVGLYFASDGAIGSSVQQQRVNRPVQIDDDDIQVIGENNAPAPSNYEPIIVDDSDTEDGIRRPMAPVTERLVGQSYHQYYGAQARRNPAHPIFEQFHDYVSVSSSRAGRHRVAHNPNAAVVGNSSNTSGEETLAALFRPPVDIIARFDWNSLLTVGKEENHWVVVNIQDPTEFACQVLNRDCWSSVALKEFIKANMLFWQAYVGDSEGRRIMGYYGINEFPAIFIVDPRTGEKVHTTTVRKPDEMLEELMNFCERYPTFKAYDDEFREKMKNVKF